MLIDSKRSHNMSICLAPLLKHFELSFEKIVDAISDNSISSDDLSVVQLIIPTADEISIILDWKKKQKDADIEVLGLAERWVLACSGEGAENIKWMVEINTFLQHYGEDLSQVRDRFNAMVSLCRRLQDNEKVRLLLKTILSVGNLTNYEYGKGSSWQQKKGATGFKVESLAKLREVKGKDGNTTLMHYLVEMLSQKAPEVFIVFLTELTIALMHICSSWNCLKSSCRI